MWEGKKKTVRNSYVAQEKKRWKKTPICKKKKKDQRDNSDISN